MAVPWGSETIIQVLFLLTLAFVFLSSCVVPIGWDLLGHDSTALSPRLQAASHLVLEVFQTSSTVGILWLCLRGRFPDGGKFPALRLRPTARWLAPTVLCCGTFPVISALTAAAQAAWPAGTPAWNMGGLESAIGAGDWGTNAMYLMIVGVCAPIWEEFIFRGFLLPSLARWMPVPAAILASASFFALAHAQGYQFLPLLMLGAVAGLLFVHTRNLLAPVLLHCVWNVWIFLQLAGPFAAPIAGVPL